MCFTKGLIRTGVIVALAGGGAVLVAETASPGSARAVLGQARGAIGSLIDGAVDDPVALRSQLERLEAEYPERIAEVRSDLGDVNEQIAELERELEISDKVVALASADLDRLDQSIELARERQSESPHAVVRIAFDNRRFELEDAYGKRSEVERTHEMYKTRASELETELSYLRDQHAQLADLLSELEQERAQFQSQIVQLDAQIESIARNERLIAVMEERQQRIDELSRYEAHSLEQFQRRVAQMRSEQKERFEQLAETRRGTGYEDRARWELDKDASTTGQVPADATGDVITVEPGEQREEGSSVASR